MRKNSTALILAGILLLSALARLWGIEYGLPCTYCRPDENRLINTALRLSFNDPNPHYFVWPSMFFYIVRGVLEGYSNLSTRIKKAGDLSPRTFYRENPFVFHLILRFLFCGFGITSIFFLFRLGERMFSPSVGLLAACFLGLSFLHVRESHFALLDIPATLFSLLFFLKAWQIYCRGKWADYLGAGFWFGLALATKYYTVLLGLSLITAHALGARADRTRRVLSATILASILVSAAVLLFTSPYLLLDLDAFKRDIQQEWSEQFWKGHDPIPEVKTARGLIHHLTFSLRYALGLPLEIICLLGTVGMVWRASRKEGGGVIIISFLLPFFVFLSWQKKCFLRYTIMLLPGLCLGGAYFLTYLFPKILPSRRWLFTVIAAAVVMGEPSYRVICHNWLLTRPDSRNLISSWMEKHLPRESGLLFPRPLIFGRPPASFQYPHRISLPRKVSPSTLKELLPFSSRGIDYLILDEHPLAYSTLDPAVKQILVDGADLIYRLDAYRPDKTRAVYDPFDAYYVPLAGFESVNLPGPNIKVYRLK